MLEHAVIVVVVLLLVGFAIPIVGGLWKVFAVRQALEEKIKENSARLQLVEERTSHMVDKQLLTLNGQRELLLHVRDRSAKAEEELERRILDLERFLEKTTDFTPRRC